MSKKEKIEEILDKYNLKLGDKFKIKEKDWKYDNNVVYWFTKNKLMCNANGESIIDIDWIYNGHIILNKV